MLPALPSLKLKNQVETFGGWLQLVKLRGSNAGGHLGWATRRCAICSKSLAVGENEVYFCPTCSERYGTYFCSSDARTLHYRCPYCGRSLELLL
ncbi:MAG: hypothetical protein LM571_01145 [Desulfurococcaceae archaeon]|nr:hypothetical protein [Desulfurococcaceae archaeon]